MADRPTTQLPINVLSMKKGKPNVPPQMRGQYKRQQEMQAMREQMIKSSTASDDGLPVFNLFVRTKRANVSSSHKDCFSVLWSMVWIYRS